jgi:hypothetical protein
VVRTVSVICIVMALLGRGSAAAHEALRRGRLRRLPDAVAPTERRPRTTELSIRLLARPGRDG